MAKLRKYQEQLERLKRWYGRFESIDQGRPHTVASDHYIDEIYAFFLSCYHLKDWIKNDSTVTPGAKNKVEDFINKNDCMSICADLCNGLKHLKLTKERSKKHPKFGARKFSLDLGEPTPIIKIECSIMTKTGTIDAFELASHCIQKWERFIKKNIV